MSVFLLDVNVLIALLDPAHVHHDPAHAWFERAGRAAWASCPLTQNAVLRILGNPKYPNSPGPPAAVMPLLSALCALPGHHFWPDDVSMTDRRIVDPAWLLAFDHLTDTYLLALARNHAGLLASFDRRIVTSAVADGARSLHLIP